MITYNFQNINANYTSYNIQCKILEEIKIIKTDSITIASLIAQDSFKNQIEIISFNLSAEFIIQQKLKQNSMYYFKYINATKNAKFKRTNHKFKLVFDTQSKVKEINCLEYKIKDQIFVLTQDVKEQSSPHKQLSITQFFKLN